MPSGCYENELSMKGTKNTVVILSTSNTALKAPLSATTTLVTVPYATMSFATALIQIMKTVE